MASTERLRYIVTADTKGFAGPIKAIGALAVTSFVAAVKVTAEFEKELSKLRAVSGATQEEMEALEQEARRLGRSTAFTAREVASLQVELAKLGFTTNDILNASGGVLDLAAGLGVQLSDAAVLTGSTLRAFGLTTEETGRVVDVLAKSASSSALDFSKLTESLKVAAPIAKATNTTIEDTVALLGTLANAGISGSLAGTALRKIFIELNAQGLSLNDAYIKINKSSDKLATATDLVGKRAGGALLTLAANAGETNNLAEALRNAEGAAQEMRRVMEDNLIGDFAKLKSAVTELGIQIGQTTDGPFRTFVQTMTKGIDQIRVPLIDLQLWWLGVKEAILEALLAFNEWAGSTGLLGDTTSQVANLEQALRDLTKRQVELLSARSAQFSGGGGGGTTSSGTVPTGGTGGGGTGGGGGNKDYTSTFGFMSFFEPEALNVAENSVKGFLTRVESEFTKTAGVIKDVSAETTENMKIGWELAAGAMASALGQAVGSGEGFKDLGKTLLKTIGGLLIAIGTAALLANTALKVFGIEISTGAAIAAIAFGGVLQGLGSSTSSRSKSGGSSSSSPSGGAVSSNSLTIDSGKITGSRGLRSSTTRGEDIRYNQQVARDNYPAYS